MNKDLKLVYPGGAFDDVELWYGDDFVGAANYDEDGSVGIVNIESIAERLQEILECKLHKEEG